MLRSLKLAMAGRSSVSSRASMPFGAHRVNVSQATPRQNPSPIHNSAVGAACVWGVSERRRESSEKVLELPAIGRSMIGLTYP